MARGVLRNLSFASRSQSQSVRERAEPRLLAGNAPLPFRRPAEPSSEASSAARDAAQAAAVAPQIAAGDRRQQAPEPNFLRYTALAGGIVFAIAGVASAGFLLLTTPTKETISAAPSSNPSGPLNTDHDGKSVSPDAVSTHPAATAIIPEPPTPAAAPAGDTISDSPSGLPRTSPTSTTSAPPFPIAAVTAAKPAGPAHTAPARPRVSERHAAAAAAPEARPNRGVVSAPADTHRPLHSRIVERHRNFRSVRELRSSKSEPQSGPFALREDDCGQPTRLARPYRCRPIGRPHSTS